MTLHCKLTGNAQTELFVLYCVIEPVEIGIKYAESAVVLNQFHLHMYLYSSFRQTQAVYVKAKCIMLEM